MHESLDSPPTRPCELCDTDGGEVLVKDDALRVVLVADPDHPAYLRVIWNDHVREMSDLPLSSQSRLVLAVLLCERCLRDTVHPAKINLASLGNVTPHLHWHVIARFANDPHFPNPIWGTRVLERAASPVSKDHLGQIRVAVRAAFEPVVPQGPQGFPELTF